MEDGSENPEITVFNPLRPTVGKINILRISTAPRGHWAELGNN